MPLLALHLPWSHTEAIMRIPQIVTYMAVEKVMELKGKRDEATLNSEEIKAVAIAIIKLRLSKGINK